MTRRRLVFLLVFTLLVTALFNIQLLQIASGDHHGDAAAAVSSEDTVCVENRFAGRLKPSAVVTMVVAPKSLRRMGLSERDANRLRFVMQTWVTVPGANFVVVSNDCPLLKLAAQYGLSTFRLAGNTTAALGIPVRRLLTIAQNAIPAVTPLVGFCNSDIMFDASLERTLRALIGHAAKQQWDNLFVTGRRINVDGELVVTSERSVEERLATLLGDVPAKGQLFQDDAQDYFVLTRSTPLVFACLPRFVVGGIVFDNWLTGLANSHPLVNSVDATATLSAVHINHGTHRHESQQSFLSNINRGVLLDNPYSRGRTTDCPWRAAPSAGGSVAVVPGAIHPPDRMEPFTNYVACAAKR
ncbi:unnamed protein product (mitochondrion) [Plasmodiophora brassicae]|uniref:Nucleotide-diphospho-sugar transferase domain-containing protein n=1 Tax=Plasmodiophora brassicae TaxID=37360 RepID=A0A0G4IYZ9_PLABS|nr:hypothetical protein PBRA_008068 [Plasmodiophora brassicae]SPQ95111.1 unnamed protein product [Plasmodiophora brassicae]